MQDYFLDSIDEDMYYLVYGKDGDRNCMCPFMNKRKCISSCSLFEIKEKSENNYVVVLHCGTKREIEIVKLKK